MANPPLPDFDFNFDFNAIESLDAEQAGPEADSDESPSLEDQLARAIADFATAEPLDAPPVNPRTPANAPRPARPPPPSFSPLSSSNWGWPTTTLSASTSKTPPSVFWACFFPP